ncbi:MAG TPA: diguanylate cyclase [Gemmatimonadales bacterium]|nr:diguanylate cyclase [Gemmatimonadales bacterium]
MFAVLPEACVGCLACVRVCPVGAIAVEGPRVQIDDDTCVGCGHCVPACPHHAIVARGDLARAAAVAAGGMGALILAPEAAAHFYPAKPEQVVNACQAAGFRVVTRGVIGDELVAMAYLDLWDDKGWGTLIRSTDPVVVQSITRDWPELVPFLAPVCTPSEAEVRYLRAKYGAELSTVYCGFAPPLGATQVEASITFTDLEELFQRLGITVASQPDVFTRIPEERRRYLSAAGGLPLAMLAEVGKPEVRRFKIVRGLHALPALAKSVKDGADLGFIDILSAEGALDHPLAGPKEELFWRRKVCETTEPPRSRFPVVEAGVVASTGATFDIRSRQRPIDERQVTAVLQQIGTGPNGKAWDCGGCGHPTCRKFAEQVSLGRATLRQCAPYQERRAEEASREAAVDGVTGLATYRVFVDRLRNEVERSKRSGESFAAVFLDLDHFKLVNDRWGHAMGNAVLKAVGAELRDGVRAADLVSRWGGDEFVALLPRTDTEGAERVAEILRERVAGVGKKLDLPEGAVTASFGVACFDPENPPVGELMEMADRALYRAKAAGRNTIARATPVVEPMRRVEE